MLNYQNYQLDMLKIADNIVLIRDKKTLPNYRRLLAKEAGEWACAALNRLLHETDFWDWVRKCQRRNQIDPSFTELDKIDIEFDPQLLEMMEYSKYADSKRLVREAVAAIEKVKSGQVTDSKLNVRMKIETLAMEICGMVPQIGAIAAQQLQISDLVLKPNFLNRSTAAIERMLANLANTVTILTFMGFAPHNQNDATIPEKAKPSVEQQGEAPPTPAEKIAFSYLLTGLQPYQEPDQLIDNQTVPNPLIDLEEIEREQAEINKWVEAKQAALKKLPRPRFIPPGNKDGKK